MSCYYATSFIIFLTSFKIFLLLNGHKIWSENLKNIFLVKNIKIEKGKNV